MNIKSKIALLIVFLILPFTYSCKSYWIKRKQIKNMKEIEKKKQERQEEAMEEYQKRAQRHADIQSPQTKREMKRNFKKYDRYQKGKKRFFLWRWLFGKKKRRTNPNNL